METCAILNSVEEYPPNLTHSLNSQRAARDQANTLDMPPGLLQHADKLRDQHVCSNSQPPQDMANGFSPHSPELECVYNSDRNKPGSQIMEPNLGQFDMNSWESGDEARLPHAFFPLSSVGIPAQLYKGISCSFLAIQTLFRGPIFVEMNLVHLSLSILYSESAN